MQMKKISVHWFHDWEILKVWTCLNMIVFVVPLIFMFASLAWFCREICSAWAIHPWLYLFSCSGCIPVILFPECHQWTYKILYRRVQAQPTAAWRRPSPILPATSPFLNSSNSSMMPNLNRPRPNTSRSNRTVFGWSALMPKEKWQKWGLLPLSQQLPELLLLQLLLLLVENDAVKPRTILTHRCTNVPKHTRCHSWVPGVSPIGTVRLGKHVIRKTSTAVTSSFRELNSTLDSNIALRASHWTTFIQRSFCTRDGAKRL